MNSLFCAAAIFFPLIMDCWEKGPLTTDRFFIPVSPVFADLKQLETQTAIYPRLPSSVQRSTLARELALTNNPEAIPVLEKLAEKEKNAFCRDDLFNAMLALAENGCGKPSSAKWLKEYFTAESPATRSAAMILYLKFARDPDPAIVVDALQKETAPFAVETVFEALRPFAAKLPKEKLETLFNSSFLPLKAVAAGLTALKESPDASDLLAKAMKDSNPLVRLQTARGLADSPFVSEKFLAELSRDSDPAVRLSAAKMTHVTPVKEAVLRVLAADKSASVRTAAAASLGQTGTSTSILALIDLIGDKDIGVRRAASDALVKLQPEKSFRDRLIAAGSQRHARREITAFFAQLNDRRYAADIQRFLKEADNDLLVMDAIGALEIMQTRDASQLIASFAGSPNPQVRRTVAKALGPIRNPDSYGTLKKLYRDKDSKVSESAAFSMFQIKDNTFRPEFLHALGTRGMEQEGIRAIACRAVSDLDYMDDPILENLNTLISKMCITAPMSPPLTDSNNVRLSGMIALLVAGKKGNPKAMKMYEENCRLLADTSKKEMNEFTNEDLQSFITQIEAFRKNEKIVPKEVKTILPAFTIYKVGTY